MHEPIPPASDFIITAYTDGACTNNGRADSRGGIGVYFGARNRHNISERLDLPKVTNQTAELLACVRAIETALTFRPKPKLIRIVSDSEYVVKSMNDWIAGWERNGWVTASKKPVQNQDLLKRLLSLSRTPGVGVLFQHMNAHTNEPSSQTNAHKHWTGNDAADTLARSAITGRSS